MNRLGFRTNTDIIFYPTNIYVQNKNIQVALLAILFCKEEFSNTTISTGFLVDWGPAQYLCLCQRLLTILNLHQWARKKHFIFWNLNTEAGDEPVSFDVTDMMGVTLQWRLHPFGDFEPISVWCQLIVCDAGPALNQYQLKVSCMMGYLQGRRGTPIPTPNNSLNG